MFPLLEGDVSFMLNNNITEVSDLVRLTSLSQYLQHLGLVSC